jgi:hypothetical protein
MASSWSIRVIAGCASSGCLDWPRSLHTRNRAPRPPETAHRVAPGGGLSATGGATRRPARTVSTARPPEFRVRALGTGLPDGIRHRARRVERSTGDVRRRAGGVQPERPAAPDLSGRALSRPLRTSGGRARSPTSRSSRRCTRASGCRCR